MKKFLRFLAGVWFLFWELPQNLVAMFIIYALNGYKSRCRVEYKEGVSVFYVKRGTFNSGVCLGEFILAPLWVMGKFNLADRSHECGHRVQSRILGPLYFLVVGVPSALRNLRARHLKWPLYKKLKWYYSGWPEKQADKLGGVAGRSLNGVKI